MDVLIIKHGQHETLSQHFQMLMALRAIKQLYPSLNLTVWVPHRHRHVFEKTPWITQVESGAIPPNRAQWDWVINWSTDPTTAQWLPKLKSRHVLGFGVGEDGQPLCHDDWSMFMKGALFAGVAEDVHLTDIWTTQVLTSLQQHLGEVDEKAVQKPVTSRSFFKLELTDDGFDWDWQHSSLKWIAVQLSQGPSTRWFVDQWVALLANMIERNPDYNVVVCGAENDRPFADQIETTLRPLLPKGSKCLFRVGQTTFDQWAHRLSRCQWLLSFPGAAVQLASLLGTRVMMLTDGKTSLQESGPYGNGHYVFSGKITPEAVVSTWTYASTEWSHQRREPLVLNHGSETSVWRSRIRTVQEGGGVVYENLRRQPLSLQEWSAAVVGQIARSWYCGWTAPAGQDLDRDRIRPELLRELRAMQESLSVLEKIHQQAMLACSQINEKSQKLHSEKVMRLQDREAIAHIATKLMELDTLIDRVTEIREPLKVFTFMRKVMMHELRGHGLTQISKQSAWVYQRLADAVRVYQDWTKATLALGKPRMVLTRPAEEVV